MGIQLPIYFPTVFDDYKLDVFPQQQISFLIRIQNLEINQKGMMINGSKQRLKNSAFCKFQAHQTERLQANLQEANEMYIMAQMINAQNLIIQKLLQSQRLLSEQLSKEENSTSTYSQNFQANIKDVIIVDTMEKEHGKQLNLSLHQFNSNLLQKDNKIRQKVVKRSQLTYKQKITVFKDKSNILLVLSDNNNSFRKKQCSKLKEHNLSPNMINNLLKGLFTFIQKSRERRLKLLTFLQIDEKDFMIFVQHYKRQIHNIDKLKQLWACQESSFHRAFRILSQLYLRKHCLQRIINSKIQNYSAHLKYMKLLQKTIKNPCQFNTIKIDGDLLI